MILREDFRDTEDLDGLFSGWNLKKEEYNPETWLYQGAAINVGHVNRKPGQADSGGGHGKDRGGVAETFSSASGPDKTGAVVTR